MAQILRLAAWSAVTYSYLQMVDFDLEFQVIKKIIATAAAVVGMAGWGHAHAYQVTFGQDLNANPETPLSSFSNSLSARARFATSTVETQDFESLATGTSGPLSLTFGSGDSAVVARLGGTAGRVVSVGPDSTEEGRFSVAPPPAAMGSKFWETTATSDGATFELWFDNPVVKFGFFGVDLFDFGGLLELEILGRDSTGAEVLLGVVGPGNDPTRPVPPAVVGDAADGSVVYMGVTAASEAEWFRGVRFRSFLPPGAASPFRAAPPDVFAFDSFTVVGAPRTPGTPVSAPGTLALLGAALLALGLLRRRAA